MRIKILSIIVTLSISGCAASAPPPTPGAVAVSAIGTPFLLAFKIPLCAASVALAGPIAGVTGLVPAGDARARDLGRDLSDGVAQNCGPPYALSP
jgi:hypothetical protein